MKKLALLITCVAVALSASAVVKSSGNAYRPIDKMQHASKMKAPSRVDIITEQPEGTVVNYTRRGEYMTVSLYGYESGYQTGRVKLVCPSSA